MFGMHSGAQPERLPVMHVAEADLMELSDEINSSVVACPDCDLLIRLPELEPGEEANCVRCGFRLARNIPDAIDHAVALTLAAVIIYAVANLFPFLSFGKGDIGTETKLISGVLSLYQEDMLLLSAAVAFTTLIVPIVLLSGLCYLLIPLKLGYRLPGAAQLFRYMIRLRAWNMIEVFVIGIIVTGVKLYKMATLTPGVSAWALLLLMFVFAWIYSNLESRDIWMRLDKAELVRR